MIRQNLIQKHGLIFINLRQGMVRVQMSKENGELVQMRRSDSSKWMKHTILKFMAFHYFSSIILVSSIPMETWMMKL